MTNSTEPNEHTPSAAPRRRGLLLRPSIIIGVATVLAILLVSFFVALPSSQPYASAGGNSSAMKTQDLIQSLPGVKAVTNPQAENLGSGTPVTGYLTIETVDGLTGNDRLTLLNQISDDLTHTEPGEQVFAEVRIQNMDFVLSGASGQDNAAHLAVSDALVKIPSVSSTSIGLPDSSNTVPVTVYSSAAVSPLALFDTVRDTVNAGIPNAQLTASLLPSPTSQTTPTIFSASTSSPSSVAGTRSVSLPAADPVSDATRAQADAVQSATFLTGYQLARSADGTVLQAAVQDEADGSRVRALFGIDERIPNVSGIGLFYPDANGNQLYKEL